MKKVYKGDLQKIKPKKNVGDITSLSLINIDLSQLCNEEALGALLQLVMQMPQLEHIFLEFDEETVRQHHSKTNKAIQNLIGFVLTQCPNLRALKFENCYLQKWNDQTFVAFKEFIDSSNVTHLDISSLISLNLNVADDRGSLKQIFTSSVRVRSCELHLDFIEDKHAEVLCEYIKESPNLSQLVIHSNNSRILNVAEFGEKLLKQTELNIVRFVENGNEVTPEEVIKVSHGKMLETVKRLTKGKGKCDKEYALEELQQFISGLVTPYCSVEMLASQISHLVLLMQNVDKVNGDGQDYFNKFIGELVRWFQVGVLTPEKHYDLLNLQQWSASLELYLQLLSTMTIGMDSEEVQARWGDPVRERINGQYLCLQEEFHETKANNSRDFEKSVDEFFDLIGRDAFTDLLGRNEQSALLLICLYMKVQRCKYPEQYLESFVESLISEFEKNYDVENPVKFLKAIWVREEHELFEKTIELLVSSMQYPITIEAVSKYVYNVYEITKEGRFQYLSLLILQHAKNKGFTDDEELFDKQLKEFAYPEEEGVASSEEDDSTSEFDPLAKESEEDDSVQVSLENVRKRIEEEAQKRFGGQKIIKEKRRNFNVYAEDECLSVGGDVESSETDYSSSGEENVSYIDEEVFKQVEEDLNRMSPVQGRLSSASKVEVGSSFLEYQTPTSEKVVATKKSNIIFPLRDSSAEEEDSYDSSCGY